jgi:Sensors of blue-light using FAD
MSDSLYRLVYLSRNEIEGDSVEIRTEIEEILAMSRINNAKVEVTGALMFNSGCFAQVLEGPQGAVQETFERIQCDFRHSRVELLMFEPVEERGFKTWSMAYVGADKTSIEEFADIAAGTDFDEDRVSGRRIYELLHEHLMEAE